jgi:carboxymethylenebutenolidase
MLKQILIAFVVAGLAGFGWLYYDRTSNPEISLPQDNITVREVSETALNGSETLSLEETTQRFNDFTGLPQFTQISTETVGYFNQTDGTTVAGYLAMPEGEGPFPALVLIHEWWGLNDNIRDLAEQYAAEGYVALAVDLYEGESATTPDEAGALAGEVRENTEGAFANLDAALAFLRNQPNVDDNRLGSVGWCFGGQWSYNMAKNNLGTNASVMYYGRFSAEDDLSMMRSQILGHFGENDRGILVDDVEQFKAKLNTLEGEHAVYIYPNAGHAFANEDSDAYVEEAAEKAWERTIEFLEANL